MSEIEKLTTMSTSPVSSEKRGNIVVASGMAVDPDGGGAFGIFSTISERSSNSHLNDSRSDIANVSSSNEDSGDSAYDGDLSEDSDDDENTGGAACQKQSSLVPKALMTMQKLQPALAVERWLHNEYNELEQVPKSPSEIGSTYEYDIGAKKPKPHRYVQYPRIYSSDSELDFHDDIKAPNEERNPAKASHLPGLNEPLKRI